MRISRFNKEGYVDLTPYKAIKSVESKKKPRFPFHPMVYICSPFAGDVETNIENARRYSKFAVDQGYLPITPHLLYPQFLDDDSQNERDLGLFFGLILLDKCSEVWVFGDYISKGMKVEIKRAKTRRQIIKYFPN
jgi:hypothetical protein